MTPRQLLLSLDAVIVAVTDEVPRVLTVADASGALRLPSGPLDLAAHSTLERGLRDWVTRQTALKLGYVEQLYTFGDRLRDPREQSEGVRVVSAAYLALVRERAESLGATAAWADVYAFLPWEDWRGGRPAILDRVLLPRLAAWAGADARRRERVELCFGLTAVRFDPERSLERYELLWEAGLVGESPAAHDEGAGRPLALDHRRILATALGRLRGKLRYRPVVFELLPTEFTLLRLQRTVEALAGQLVHKQNFRRLVEHAGLVERTGRIEASGRGRPAELFRFRPEVLRERPAPGVGLPRTGA